MKTYGELDVHIHVFLTLRERTPGTHWIGGLTFRKTIKYYQPDDHANLRSENNDGIIQYKVFKFLYGDIF
jgi:hypothetical protein